MGRTLATANQLILEEQSALSDFRRALRALQDYLRLYPDGTKASEARALLEATANFTRHSPHI